MPFDDNQTFKAQKVDTVEILDGPGIVSGTKHDTYLEDAVSLVIGEDTGDPGFAVAFTFGNIRVLGKYSNQVRFNIAGYYDGDKGHNVRVYIWNYSTEDWDPMTADVKDMADATAKEYYQFAVDTNSDVVLTERFKAFVGYNREVKILIRQDEAGDGAHELHLDQVYLDFPAVGTDRHRQEIAHA